jgi:hypothetical protein
LFGHQHQNSPTAAQPNKIVRIESQSFAPRADAVAGYSGGLIDLAELSGVSDYRRVFQMGQWRWNNELHPFPAALEVGGARAVISEQIAPADEPIYVQSLHVKGFRCFNDLELDFHHPSSLAGEWTCIAGINGAGKSSVLQALCLVLLGKELAPELGGGLLDRMRRSVDGVRQRAEIRAELKTGGTDRTFGVSLEIDDGRVVSPTSNVSSGLRSRVIVAYGATRNLSLSYIDPHENKSYDVRRQITMFEPLSQLASAEVLLRRQEGREHVLTLFEEVDRNAQE